MSIYDLGEMENRRRKAMERQKKPPTGSAEALVHCMENASAVQPIELSSSFAYIKSQAVSDDPIEWLVKEFGAEVMKHDGVPVKDPSFAWIACEDSENDNWLLEYHADTSEWLVFNNYTSQPLTRADVARLCELFGVEVKQ